MSAQRRGGASSRAGSQAGALAVLLVGALGGCSLVVGDIELPPATGLDAAVDAAIPLDASPEAGRDLGPDAAPPDAAPPDQQPPDLSPPDLAVDQWVVDATPDAVVDAAPDAWVAARVAAKFEGWCWEGSATLQSGDAAAHRTVVESFQRTGLQDARLARWQARGGK